MKGIPIKFRVWTDNGEYLYLTPALNGQNYEQLIGYDVDGNEVYEGDVLKDFEGNSYTATLEARVEWKKTETDSKCWTFPLEQWKNFEKANQEKSLVEKGK